MHRQKREWHEIKETKIKTLFSNLSIRNGRGSDIENVLKIYVAYNFFFFVMDKVFDVLGRFCLSL